MDCARPATRGAAVAVLLGLVTGLGLAPRALGTSSTPGLVEVSRKAMSARLLELRMRTPALSKDTFVRVLLPADYTRNDRRYPVLYLFNGGGGSWLDWTDMGAAEAHTASLPLIVVMPDGGTGGNYTDWYAPDSSGKRPLWETYHLSQLLPWVDAHFRTIPDRAHRAAAGLSMGGNGALHYAARHPDLFVAAASFSGANDVFEPVIEPITETTGISEGDTPGAVFGPRATEEIRWRGSNPVDLAGNLRDTWVSLAFGNGMPGGPGGGGLPLDPIEYAVHDANVTLHSQLEQHSVSHVYNDYGAGNHSWYYWSRGFQQALPRLMRVFAENRPAPVRFTHSAIEPTYTVYDWQVSLTRPALEWSQLVNASPEGFVLRGSGTAVVRTPSSWDPGTRLSVTTRDRSGVHRTTMTVGPDRRLTTKLALGPGNPYQEDTVQARALGGTKVYQASVTITPTQTSH